LCLYGIGFSAGEVTADHARSPAPGLEDRFIQQRLPTDREMLRKWLKTRYLKDRQWFPTEMGVPQGGIISPPIANWVLDGLQRHLATAFGPPQWIDGRQISSKINDGGRSIVHVVRTDAGSSACRPYPCTRCSNARGGFGRCSPRHRPEGIRARWRAPADREAKPQLRRWVAVYRRIRPDPRPRACPAVDVQHPRVAVLRDQLQIDRVVAIVR